MKRLVPYLILGLLAVGCFSLATVLQARAYGWSRRAQADNILKVLLGDGRRLFANHFFIQADVSFHSGYYPSIFDQARAAQGSRHLTAEEGDPAHEEHEKSMDFLGPPRDWIERFGRHFMVTDHTHLHGDTESEILPWLKISAELDPQKVETYTVAAYWLRKLNKAPEAEEFLREGLRNNPNSHEILFELGRLSAEYHHDPARARKMWELGLRKWADQEAAGQKPDLFHLDQLAVHLARLEEKEGNLVRAIELLQLAIKATPHPEALQRQIEELEQRRAAHAPGASPPAR
ncbi:MAG: hypothetical protein QM840_07970 [Verrucomicrobiota bacterium]|nr:hypothetical protein [Verrucomicrobiota bacterium]